MLSSARARVTARPKRMLEEGFRPRVRVETGAEDIAEAIVKAPLLAMRLGKRAIDRGIELDPQGARQVEIEAIEEQLSSGQWMGKS